MTRSVLAVFLVMLVGASAVSAKEILGGNAAAELGGTPRIASVGSPGPGLAPARPWRGAGGAYLGVACGNVTTCDRVGVAVWLTHPASEVDATLAGVHVRLEPPRRTQDYWGGFVYVPLRSLGLPSWWDGAHPAKAMTLHLRLHYSSGWRDGDVRVELSPGWG
jgi:hypothetical protein